jgi:predicted aminopeptidase
MLLRIDEIKRYSSEKLGLSSNENYTQYVKIEKDYLVDVVSASRKDRFQDYTWWFPFFGSFPYKGFYKREDALELAKELKKKNLDVLVRKVDAFSTLGFFSDPVYSFMADYSLFELASLIIHEQAHATVFIDDHVQFNENLASFVEREGALAFLRDRLGENSAEYREAELAIGERDTFIRLMKQLVKKLRNLYKSKLPREEILKSREVIFKAFQKEFLDKYDSHFKTGRYRFFGEIKAVNNAYLRLYMLYESDLKIFYRLYESQNRNLKKTVEILKKLKDMGGEPMENLKKFPL